MNPEAELTPAASTAPSALDAGAVSLRPPSRWRRILFAPVKFLLGMTFFQSPLGGLGCLGWTCRLMQRSALRRWWKAAEPESRGATFAEFAAADPRTRTHSHWPNWILSQNFQATLRQEKGTGGSRRIVGFVRALVASLWLNVVLGVRAAFNVWVFTLPGCSLILFGWYAGWQNSFNKGYEQFWVGPLTGWIGILALIAAMFHVPLAQARQAVTGDWRSFYQFRLLRTLRRRRGLAVVGLAALYTAATFPLTILMGVPMFLPQINPALADATPEQVAAILNSFYFWSAAFLLPAFVILRLLAARIYASALLDAIRSGAIHEDDLGENEWHVLHRLDLLHFRPAPARRTWVRVVAWAGSRAGRITVGVTTFLLWFLCISQTLIQQFFHYTGAIGWLNLPLLQIPWFHHLPAGLQNPWTPVSVALLVVAGGWQLSRLGGWIRSLRKA